MKVVFSVLSLLIVVAVVGMIAKKQLTTSSARLPETPGAAAAAPDPSNAPASAPAATPQQQVQQAVQGLMQQPRAMPEGK